MVIFLRDRNSSTRGISALQRDEKAAGGVFFPPAGRLAGGQEGGLLIPV